MKNYGVEDELFIEFKEHNDVQSFNKLFFLINSWLFKVIYRIVADKALAEDILQDTWKNVITNKHRFDPKIGSFNNYIFTIAKNNSLKWKNKDARHIFLKINDKERRNIKEEAINPDEGIMIKESNLMIRSAISTLKKDYKDAILLYYFGELSILEIATKLSKPENTIKTLLVRGREKLSKQLAKQEERLTETLLVNTNKEEKL